MSVTSRRLRARAIDRAIDQMCSLRQRITCRTTRENNNWDVSRTSGGNRYDVLVLRWARTAGKRERTGSDIRFKDIIV